MQVLLIVSIILKYETTKMEMCVFAEPVQLFYSDLWYSLDWKHAHYTNLTSDNRTVILLLALNYL